MRVIVFRLVLIGRLEIECVGIVGQTASLAQLLEDDAVHGSAIVLVEHLLHGSLIRIPGTLFVMIHSHIDVLGIVWGYQHLVLRSGLQHVVLALGNGLQRSRHLVGISDGLSKLVSLHRTVIEYGMLILRQVLQ